MALPTAKIQEMPDLICVGAISEVAAVKEPAEGKTYHTITIDIEAGAGGRDSKYVLCFQPKWFDNSFDDAALQEMAETDAAAGNQYGPNWMYGRTVSHQSGRATLQVLAQCTEVGAAEEDANGFSKLSAAFAAVNGTMDGQTVQEILRDFLLGKEVGYVLKQRKDKQEDGSKVLTDQYQVNSFFVPTDKGMAYWTRAKGKTMSDGRPSRIVTWNEE
jgi:hypothetical protein